MTWLSSDLRFKWFWLAIDLRFNMIQLILVVCWIELQVRWLSIDLGFKRFGWQSSWDSNDLVVNVLCETSFKNEALKIKKRSFSARLPSKAKLCSSKTKLFCETSFKNETVQLTNKAFVRDFLQKWRFEDQKRSISARLPSKTKLWSSKTKVFCETSFKIEALKIKNEAFLRDFLQKWKNEAFLRDFLQKWNFEDQKRSFSARLPSKLACWADTWPQNANTF